MIVFKKSYPTLGMSEYQGVTQYYEGQIVELSTAEEKFFVDGYFAEVYDNKFDYYQPYDMVSNKSGKVIEMIGPDGRKSSSAPNPTWNNLKPSNMLRWRAAYANYIAGISNAKIMCVGDSTTAGEGAGAVNAADANRRAIGMRANSYPVRMASILNRIFGAVDSSHNYNSIRPSFYATTLNQIDPRITVGAGWVETDLSNAFGTIKGSQTTGALSFAISKVVDTVEIVLVQTNIGGAAPTLNFTANGVSVASYTPTSVGTLQKITRTFTSQSTGSFTITPATATGETFVAHVYLYNSALKEISVTNHGVSGASVGSYGVLPQNNSFNHLPSLAIHKPDLFVLMLTINDSQSRTALTTYKERLGNIISAAKAQGSVLLATGFPSNTTQATTEGILQSLVAANYELADQFDVPLLDLDSRFVSYATTNPIIPYADSLHLTAQGYADAAQAFADVIIAAQ